MKKGIEHFLKSYFYFNRQEKRGIYPLLAIIVLIQTGLFLQIRFSNEELPRIEVQQLAGMGPAENISFSDEDGTDNKENNYPSPTHYRNAFPPKTISHFKPDSFVFAKKKAPEVIELNRADSAQLVSLRGIGPVLASRIVEYRDRIGGFRSLDQLTEVYGFKEDLLFDLEGRLVLGNKEPERVDLNTVSLVELRKHPYFKYTLSNAVIQYRKQHGPFASLEDLRKIRIVNDSLLNRIKDYVEFSGSPH